MGDSGFNRRSALGGVALGLAASGAQAAPAPRGAWFGAWGAMLQRRADAPRLTRQTLRVPVRLSAGGQRLRIRLSNEFGARPLAIGAVSVAAGGAPVPLTFGGGRIVTLPPGAPVLSDPVALSVKPGQVVEIRIHLPDETAAETYARTPDGKGAFATPAGDFTLIEAPGGADFAPSFLSAVEVFAAKPPPVLVILGDTKSAGAGTWPEMFVERVAGRWGVVNRSQFAGLMQLGAPGESALARFDRDVLSVPGATHVLIFTGNNDLIQPGMAGSNGRIMMDAALAQSAEQLTWGLSQLAERTRAAGLKPVAGTWLPYEGVEIVGYAAPEKLAKRDRVNAWIRGADAFDQVIDFDAALRDPARPQRLRSDYDSGNRFTPSPAGYRAMAETAARQLRA